MWAPLESSVVPGPMHLCVAADRRESDRANSVYAQEAAQLVDRIVASGTAASIGNQDANTFRGNLPSTLFDLASAPAPPPVTQQQVCRFNLSVQIFTVRVPNSDPRRVVDRRVRKTAAKVQVAKSLRMRQQHLSRPFSANSGTICSSAGDPSPNTGRRLWTSSTGVQA